jgi:hypothetical protein
VHIALYFIINGSKLRRIESQALAHISLRAIQVPSNVAKSVFSSIRKCEVKIPRGVDWNFAKRLPCCAYDILARDS